MYEINNYGDGWRDATPLEDYAITMIRKKQVVFDMRLMRGDRVEIDFLRPPTQQQPTAFEAPKTISIREVIYR